MEDEHATSTFKDDEVIVYVVFPTVTQIEALADQPHLSVWLLDRGTGPNEAHAKLETLAETGEASPADLHVMISPMPGREIVRALDYAKGIVTHLQPLVPE
jgi:hypothetical protein